MNKTTLVFVCLITLFLGACAGKAVTNGPDVADAGYKYICACGTGCDCYTMSDKPGKCSCGKELMYKKVLKEDADNLYFCACGPKCNCTSASADKTRCSCGKELMSFPKQAKVSCACGKGCNCNTVSQKPGQCSCGMEMKPAGT